MVTLTCESGLKTDFSWTPGGVQGAECTETVYAKAVFGKEWKACTPRTGTD